MNKENCCCPKFIPEPWDEKEITWENKRFVTDRVRSFFHIPLNFPQVMKRIMNKVEASNVKCEEMIVLADEDSLWGTNVFVDVSGDVKDGKMASISGTFLTKVFEGHYKNMGKWIKEMEQYVKSKDKEIKMQYFYYTTCPKCAKKYGKNYVVLLSKINQFQHNNPADRLLPLIQSLFIVTKASCFGLVVKSYFRAQEGSIDTKC